MLYNFAVLLPCSMCLLLASLICRNLKNNTRPLNILALLCFTAAVFFFIESNFIVGVNNFVLYYRLDIVDSFITLTIFPLMCIYFRTLTDESELNWKEFLQFLPALIIGGITLMAYTLMGKNNAIEYTMDIVNDLPYNKKFDGFVYSLHTASVIAYNLTFIAQVVITYIYSINKITKYHKELRDFYSSLDDKSIGYNRHILIWANIFLALSLVFITTGGRDFLKDHHYYTMIFCTIWSIPFFEMCYYTIRMKYTVKDYSDDVQKAEYEENNISDQYVSDNIKNDTPDDKLMQLFNIFNELIAEDKIYLRCALRVDEVAQMLHTNRTYVSKIINNNYNCSFSDFINGKRIEYAKELIISQPNLKQDELADKCGFLSASSLNKTFKQITGDSPKVWYKNYCSSQDTKNGSGKTE